MTNRMKLLWVAGAILLAVGGAAMASNMGFKFLPNIQLGDPNIYDVAIPLNNNYTTLQSIFDDINASAGCAAASVTSFSNSPVPQTPCAWVGDFSCNAAFSAGQAVRVTTSGTCTGWVIVGSHNPTFIFQFAQPDPNIYDVSVPYHTTKTDLAGLFAEIPNAASVTIFGNNPVPQTPCAWVGDFSCNAPLEIGQAVRVTVGVANSTWTPSHY